MILSELLTLYASEGGILTAFPVKGREERAEEIYWDCS